MKNRPLTRTLWIDTLGWCGSSLKWRIIPLCKRWALWKCRIVPLCRCEPPENVGLSHCADVDPLKMSDGPFLEMVNPPEKAHPLYVCTYTAAKRMLAIHFHFLLLLPWFYDQSPNIKLDCTRGATVCRVSMSETHDAPIFSLSEKIKTKQDATLCEIKRNKGK